MPSQPSLWQRTTRPTKLYLYYAAILLITTTAMLIVWRDSDRHPEEWTHTAHNDDAVQHAARTLDMLNILDGRVVGEEDGRSGTDREEEQSCEGCREQMRRCTHDCHKHVIQCNWECECEVLKRDAFCRDQCRFKCGSGWSA